MPPRDRDLRGDSLGTLLARSFADTRTVRPSPAVWKRIGRDLDPPRGGGSWGRLGRLSAIVSPDGRPVAQLLAWAALPSAAAVGLLVFLGRAAGEAAPSMTGARPRLADRYNGLSAAELAFQRRTQDLWIGMPAEDLLNRHTGPRAVPRFGLDPLLSLAVAPGIAIR